MPDLFRGGTLEMSHTPIPQEAAAQVWSDCLVNRIAAITGIVLLLIMVSDLIGLMPALLRCIGNRKANIELEHSLSQARTRNRLTIVMAYLFCLLADRWGLIAPAFKTSLPAYWQLAVTAAVVAGFFLLRRLLYLASKFRSRIDEYSCLLRHTLFNYFILMVALMLPTALLLYVFRVPDATVRVVLLVEAAVLVIRYLSVYLQFLGSRCNIFATILYLCALEILPIGILIFVCTL